MTFLLVDPRGRPKVKAGSDHYFHTWRLSVPTCHNLPKQNNFQVRIVTATVWTVGLAMGINVGIRVLFFFIFKYYAKTYKTYCTYVSTKSFVSLSDFQEALEQKLNDFWNFSNLNKRLDHFFSPSV